MWDASAILPIVSCDAIILDLCRPRGERSSCATMSQWVGPGGSQSCLIDECVFDTQSHAATPFSPPPSPLNFTGPRPERTDEMVQALLPPRL